MIKNLPNKVKIEKFMEFSFGTAEAEYDDLLFEDCFCKIPPVVEFLKGRKSIVSGAKGSGKSAIFRLIKEEKIKFENNKKLRQIIIPIEEANQYAMIREIIVPRFFSAVDRDDYLFKYIWELFLIFKIVSKISEEFANIPSDIEKFHNTFLAQMGAKEKKISFFDAIGALETKIGCKIDSMSSPLPIPDFYVSFKRGSNVPGSETETTIINLDDYKAKLCNFLNENNAIVYILIDKLDEFVIGEEYKIQKKMISGLMSCDNGYAKHSEIRIKTFLRSDLYNDIDNDTIQHDKLLSRTIFLKWRSGDIREFVAKRIVRNYKNYIGINKIKINVNENKLNYGIDSDKTKTLILKTSDGTKIVPSSILSMIRKIMPEWNYRERRIDYDDEISRLIITSIFPRNIEHYNSKGKKERIDVFDFFDNHFLLSDNSTTPRIIIMYIEDSLAESKKYYSKNTDIKFIRVNSNHEYPLIMMDHLERAYRNLQANIWEIVMKATKEKEWRDNLEKLKNKKKGKVNLTFSELRSLFGSGNDAEIACFLGYLCHLGVLGCKNNSKKLTDRNYAIPIIFQSLKS